MVEMFCNLQNGIMSYFLGKLEVSRWLQNGLIGRVGPQVLPIQHRLKQYHCRPEIKIFIISEGWLSANCELGIYF